MLIKMNKTTKITVPSADGPSGVEFLMKGEEYTVDDDIGGSLVRGGEAVALAAAVASPTTDASSTTEEPAKKRGPKFNKNRGAAPENK